LSKPNRLIDEKSPYLLQHANNPVDWYPWAEEAFKTAMKEDKPIFLSIGYSTCHWCHVMEHESFMNQQVADLLNSTFINIKVDREERPDIDGVYMTVCQMLTGSGGWPLTIIMTPDKKPFYAATYIPRNSGFGRVGMLDLIPQLKNYWINQRQRLVSISEDVVLNLKPVKGGNEDVPVTIFDTGFRLLDDSYDNKYGGFGSSPKFPTPHNLLFLLRYWKRTGKKKALEMVEKTLTAMKNGGVYDHIGYGFHRYSTDQEWLVPHFEKMLYDQAMLLMAYSEAYQATGNPDYKTTGEEIISYVLRDLTSPNGGFYSAEDADSEGEEGKFYVWTTKELKEILNEIEYRGIAEIYNVTLNGNFLDEATKTKTGNNILHLISEVHENQVLEAAKNKLFEVRENRVRPLLDDKILTDWNGLMIVGLCKAGRAFRAKEYIEEAVRAIEFILANMWDGVKLLHRYREEEAEIEGFLNDYAFTTWALIELYQATNVKRYLDTAIILNQIMLAKFNDADGGLFFTAYDAEELIARRKELYDGALPSGNSVAFYNLLRLARFTGNTSLEEEARKISRYFSSRVLGNSQAYTMFLTGLDFAYGPTIEVVISGDKASEVVKEFDNQYTPNTIFHVWSKELADSIEYLSNIQSSDETMIYVCKDFVCNLPTSNIDEAIKKISER
jgi:uncharacterized protein YyaL (SSP411 family)